MRSLLCSLAVALLITSCNTNTVKVYVDKEMTEKDTSFTIIFDGKDVFSLSPGKQTVSLTAGKHTYSLKGSSTVKEFTVGPEGGLLNLDNKEYVAFEIEYRATKQNNGSPGYRANGLMMKAVILIDSFVITPNMGTIDDDADSSLLKILPALQRAKNGNYYANADKSSYDTDEVIYGLKKFGKDKLFVNKFWDYNPGDDIPQTIEIRTSRNILGTPSETKSTIIDANTFLLLAKLSPDEYTVKAIEEIKSGKGNTEKYKEGEEIIIHYK